MLCFVREGRIWNSYAIFVSFFFCCSLQQLPVTSPTLKSKLHSSPYNNSISLISYAPIFKQLNRIRQILQIVLMLWTLPRSLDQEGNLMGYSQFKESWLTANIFINVYRWMVVGKGVCLHNVVLIMFSIQRSQCNLQRNLSDVFHFSWSKEQTWSNFSRACSNWWKSSAVGCQICFP